MTVYQVTNPSPPVVLIGDGTDQTSLVTADQALNPITGNIGISVVRFINESTSNWATMSWTPTNVTYPYPGVAYTTDSVNGIGAIINVTVAYPEQAIVAVAFGGQDYVVGDTITVPGTAFGQSSPGDDLTITVDAVDLTGAITEISTTGIIGAGWWPQSIQSQIYIAPMSENFIQVAPAGSNGCNFTGNCVDGFMVITPVTIVG